MRYCTKIVSAAPLRVKEDCLPQFSFISVSLCTLSLPSSCHFALFISHLRATLYSQLHSVCLRHQHATLFFSPFSVSSLRTLYLPSLCHSALTASYLLPQASACKPLLFPISTRILSFHHKQSSLQLFFFATDLNFSFLLRI